MYLLAGLLLGAKPDELYTGLWGYNAALTATAIGGVFYTPNRLSISIGLICAFLASIIASILLAPLFSLLKLPVLSVPFAIVTIGCCLMKAAIAAFPCACGSAYSGESRGTSTAVPCSQGNYC
jgi:urea transporter